MNNCGNGGRQAIMKDKKDSQKNKDAILILHNIRSAYNVGSILRTADAASISKIYFTGHTPTPLDQFGRKRKDIHKTALGAEESVVWEHVYRISVLINRLKEHNFFIIGIEQAPGAVNYKKVKIKYPVAFIFGNEVRGLSKQILYKCDVIAEIPMQGSKESLNVSVAAGISLFRMLNH